MELLLVEDEGLVREGLALLIRATVPDCVVHTAGTLTEARALIPKRPFDFVLLDVRLRGESGLDYLTELKDQGVTTPVIMLSSQDDRSTVMRAIECGAYGFIPKQGDDPKAIRQALEIVLAGQVYFPPSARGRGRAPSTIGNRAYAAQTSVRLVSCEELGLSPRVYEAVYYVAQGLSNKAISRKMEISGNVVAEYVSKAYSALAVTGRAQLMATLNRKAWQLAAPKGR